MTRIEQPSFLSEGNLEDRHYLGEGAFVTAVELPSVTATTAEQVPQKYVLKQYMDVDMWGESNWPKLFWGDPDMASLAPTLKKDPFNETLTHEEWPLLDIAKKLRERHERMKEFFRVHGLPDLIVPTNFIIGAEQNTADPTRDGRKHIYEIQPKILPLEIPSGIVRDAFNIDKGLQSIGQVQVKKFSVTEMQRLISIASENFSDFLFEDAGTENEVLSLKALQKIVSELSLFVEAAKKIPKILGIMTEDIVVLRNLFITSDGLRLVDTNFAPRWKEQVVPSWQEKIIAVNDALSEDEILLRIAQSFERLLAFWEAVRNKLKARVSHTVLRIGTKRFSIRPSPQN